MILFLFFFIAKIALCNLWSTVTFIGPTTYTLSASTYSYTPLSTVIPHGSTTFSLIQYGETFTSTVSPLTETISQTTTYTVVEGPSNLHAVYQTLATLLASYAPDYPGPVDGALAYVFVYDLNNLESQFSKTIAPILSDEAVRSAALEVKIASLLSEDLSITYGPASWLATISTLAAEASSIEATATPVTTSSSAAAAAASTQAVNAATLRNGALAAAAMVMIGLL